ncbi:uncharacterized protein LOC116431458 [Nomia melanderi]|uniref:uncharacterized protein LOC116431458 n=1 Tax=Nomia melanderi TaxID=2448451 RepID=UPI0013040691|nr:protein LTO1 homolog [Nomia melanderi]XP_031842778.1 protein LTO1 homolog [Nomia melanderi]
MSNEEDVDVNKEFENLLFAEENAQNEGYEEGYETGRQQLIKGFHLGYHRASVIGALLGYYCGVLEQYLSTDKSDSKKAVSVAKELLQSIYNFPRFNDETTDISNTVDNIKFKYAKFCSLTGTCALYPETDKLDF